ncbi:MAG: CehA/McbA family metallohydrolase [Planctomycetes bacterium]|nr:CehA/McbA family metallohydrolase [Planctomycetota bacterium]
MILLIGGIKGGASGADVPIVSDVEFQPLASQAQRVREALEFVGAPLSETDRKALEAACKQTDAAKGIREIQKILDPYVLVFVNVNPESRVKVAAGTAKPELQEQGWRTFLVKVHNEAGVTAQLRAESPNAAPLYSRSTSSPDPFGKVDPKKAVAAEKLVKPGEVSQRFLDIAMFDQQPLAKTLSGLKVEYRLIQLYSRDAGKREAQLDFNVGQGTQDIGFRNAVPILFNCVPSSEVVLHVLDDNGKPTTGSFIFRDQSGRVYPAQSRRLAPDFFFHAQIYRADGESVKLPPGTYSVEYTRGPEYLIDRRTVEVPDSTSHTETFRLRRWIHPAKMGWYSGDHHVHAAGCAHYESPTEGVTPKDMMRHILGEDLNVGCVLSWGPCWYYQKEFFEGKVHSLSTADYLMRYDVEVSGFPSSHAGHLCLLRLKEDDYTPPGGKPTKYIEEWPSWDLPVLRWGKEQGGVVGFSHSGWGLQVAPAAAAKRLIAELDANEDGKVTQAESGKGLLPESFAAIAGANDRPITEPDLVQSITRVANRIPNLAIPEINGIGANEYLVDVALDTCDFISSVDTPSVWELNIWYHTLNCGFRAKLSGETDFPCIYGERVGLGRVYVKLDGKLDFDQWAEGIKQGRSYVGDGRSHLIDFTVNDRQIGSDGSELRLAKPGTVRVRVKAAAFLPEQQSSEAKAIQSRPQYQKPYWDIERARIGSGRKVPVELVVNGLPMKGATKELVADGRPQDLEFDVPIERSSWIAVRVLPSSHTNPIFVLVGDKPIRVSRRSADWCLKSIDQCWTQKEPKIRDSEKAEAKRAYEEAKAIYRQILQESAAD